MISRIISYFRYLSTILIAVLMLFALPTPTAESQLEVTRTTLSTGIESNVKWLVRKHQSASDAIRLALLLSASLLPFLSGKSAFLRILPAIRHPFCPQIGRRLTHLRLSPIKFTSLYV